ncbi:hypothetical protein D3C86_1996900 [compost metagenome]
MACQHAFGQRGNDLYLFAAGFNIYQRQFGHRQFFDTLDQPINQFWRVTAAAADHGDFQGAHARTSIWAWRR